MKRSLHGLSWFKTAAFVLAVAFGLSARAESPREELVHAFHLLKTANSDYNGHGRWP